MQFLHTCIFLLIVLFCKKNNCYDKTNNIIEYTTGLKKPISRQINMMKKNNLSIYTVSNIPSSWDWRELTGNIKIRNQGGCGSCWAFATNGPIEFLIKYKTGYEIDLSEQFLISCNEQGFSCSNGGWWAFDEYKTDGLISESIFPYIGRDIPCKQCQPINYIRLTDWNYVDINGGIPNIELLKSAIIQYGPVAVGVHVDNEFYGYKNGIFDYNSPYGINHAVVIIGWNDDTQSWLIRNSWGTGWGINGHMFIRYGHSSIGDGAAYVNIEIQNDFYINFSPNSQSPCHFNSVPNISPIFSPMQSPSPIINTASNFPSISPFINHNPCNSPSHPSFSQSKSSSCSPKSSTSPYYIYHDQCITALQTQCNDIKTGVTIRTKQSDIRNCVAAPSAGLGLWFYLDIIDHYVSKLELNTHGSNYDTQLSLYRGQCNNLICVGKNDDYNNLRTSHILLYDPIPDRYYIVVHGYGATVGFVNLSISC